MGWVFFAVGWFVTALLGVVHVRWARREVHRALASAKVSAGLAQQWKTRHAELVAAHAAAPDPRAEALVEGARVMHRRALDALTVVAQQHPPVELPDDVRAQYGSTGNEGVADCIIALTFLPFAEAQRLHAALMPAPDTPPTPARHAEEVAREEVRRVFAG